MPTKIVKENVLPEPPLSTCWLLAALIVTGLSFIGVSLIDYALPEPLTRNAPAEKFIADIAYEHLVNLTSIGPRVAGSYENEVLAVNVLVGAVKQIAREASPHNRVELDLHVASGAFPLTFLDGMTNIYHGVQSVVVRISGAGGKPRGKRKTAILLNCHFDTVPDSPGASDDGAGCAVLLEVMRALAATRHPLKHDVIFLLNGAEENIMQASHGFITQHKWAKTVRAFINIEACGAGGREVLFQAGPNDPWIMEVYADVVPHPFASSLAQELFESGLIPADTDFRIFRDFGKLSGVDLAWSSNGYVYHTKLDTADNIPKSSIQRTGDNVLALTQGMLASESLEKPIDMSGQPVYFDVLGVIVVSGRAPLAVAMVTGAVVLLLLKIHVSATRARRALYTTRWWWWKSVLRAMFVNMCSFVAGCTCACVVAVCLHVLRRRLAFYTHVWLLAPLYGLPAVAVSWLIALRYQQRDPAVVRGWWTGGAWHDGGAALSAAVVVTCAALGLRSAFLPLLWTLLPTLADLLPLGPAPVRWAAGAAVCVLQSWYLSVGSLRMFVPVMARAGARSLPADVVMAALVAGLVLSAAGWVLPLVLTARKPHRLIYTMLSISVVTCIVVLLSPALPYGARTPQRLMLFHTSRSVHQDGRTQELPPTYWLPDLDDNSPYTLQQYVPAFRDAVPVTQQECDQYLYCGAPYYLPVLTLIARSHRLPAVHRPLPTVHSHVTAHVLNSTHTAVRANITGPAHIAVIASPIEGAHISWCNILPTLQQSAPWGTRRTYFITLHRAREPAPWTLELLIEHNLKTPPKHWMDLSIAGHSLFGDQKLHPEHESLVNSLPTWVAATGWGVDLHLYTV